MSSAASTISLLRNTLTRYYSFADTRSIEIIVTKREETRNFHASEYLLRKASKALKKLLKELAPDAPLTVNNISPAAFAEVLRFLRRGQLFVETTRDGYQRVVKEEIELDVCNLACRWEMRELFNEALGFLEISFGHYWGESHGMGNNLVFHTSELYFDMSGPPNLRQYMTMLVALRPFNRTFSHDKELTEDERQAKRFASDIEDFIGHDAHPFYSFLHENDTEDVRAQEAQEARKKAKASDYRAQSIKIVLYHGEEGLKKRYQFKGWTIYNGDKFEESRVVKGDNVPFVRSLPVEKYFLK